MSHAVPDNFGGLPRRFCDYRTARIAVLPVPFDKTSTWGKGADKGPAALIAASRQVEWYDCETGVEAHRHGIATLAPVRAATPEAMVRAVRARTARLFDDGKFMVLLGGEHSVSAGAIEAHAARYPGLSVLHLDAHSDRRDRYEGSRFNHACVMARAQQTVDGRVVSVGIRSMDASELPSVDPKRMFYAHRLRRDPDWVLKAVRLLTKDVYVTVDLDVFDSGLMPSTGTPEPGGLDWYQVTDLLREACARRNVVGLDVVELCPNKTNRAPDFLAAKLVFKVLSYKFK